ncbi:mandelate racemase/muconate lactonizing enzyme family protein [Pelagibius sp. Alg239-R121]|uniref:mandelate racemase/muconate lactonizing enzyme family protein n=1 Tax=Pelagibius sp. Alg239-R121 TaxID=2993448 RepID=UPI0024A6F0AC|nr:mandelate racemase/muconate lactonizing enzyme family protein [Pelagibius sp. Alg239-R121]
MKLTAVSTYLVAASESPDGWSGIKPFLFVKLETDSGIEGWGEAYALAGRETAIEQIILSLTRGFLGQEVIGPRTMRQTAILDFADKRTGIDFFCALSALELALWDLQGKRIGAPVHELLGGALRNAIPLYVNTWSDQLPSAEMVVERTRKLKADGYRAVKVYPMQYPDLNQAEDFLRAVREAVGPETDVMVDLNALNDPYLALQAARRFEPYDLFWFEEPVTSDDLDLLGEIRSQVPMRVVSGERHGGKFKFREMLTARVADVLNPDIVGCGGILELLEISALAESFSVAVSPHNYNSTTIAMAAMLQVSAVIPNLLTAELYPDYLDAGRRFADVDFDIAGGYASLPFSHGLGVTMNEDALNGLSRKTSISA